MINIQKFIGEVKTEMTRVAWPNYAEWSGSTIVVLIIIAAFAVYLGVVDQLLSKLARMVY